MIDVYYADIIRILGHFLMTLFIQDVIAVKLFNNSSYADVEEGTTGNYLCKQ